ncbi:DUF4435 domain-containing protein [Enterobacter cloacae]|uniref:DUF4435 domain-containing protein n=2 Tax=Enterobacter TaxID=547 RepID=UPI002A3902E3|nr:DUF4435 domain-containing protein [Enterobacter cloacae]
MSELSELMRSEAFIRIYTGMASSDSQKGIIYIEDASDRIFWELVVNTVCPGKYDVKPYSRGGAQGKRKLEQEYRNLHKYLLVAVDADYDYLCPNRNEHAQTLNCQPYILHTFFYSRESYINSSNAVDSLTRSIHLNVQTEHQISQVLRRYSSIIYDALSLFSWLHDRDSAQFDEHVFNDSIKLNDGLMLLDENLNINEDALEYVTQSVRTYCQQHEQYIDDLDSYREHCASLSTRGITPENAMLFTNGHNLLDHIFYPIYRMYIKKCRANDLNWVAENYPEIQVRDRKRQVSNHYSDNCRAETLVYHCNEYRDDPFWTKITEKLQQANNAA